MGSVTETAVMPRTARRQRTTRRRLPQSRLRIRWKAQPRFIATSLSTPCRGQLKAAAIGSSEIPVYPLTFRRGLAAIPREVGRTPTQKNGRIEVVRIGEASRLNRHPAVRLPARRRQVTASKQLGSTFVADLDETDQGSRGLEIRRRLVPRPNACTAGSQDPALKEARCCRPVPAPFAKTRRPKRGELVEPIGIEPTTS